jgi:hypothetical protein
MLCSINIYAQNEKEVNLTVSGQGKTIDEAKANGFRSAIEQAYKVFISSNTEILNDDIIKNEIVSNGNIKEFEVLNQGNLANGVHTILLRITISITKLTDFCKIKGIPIEIKGSGLLGDNLKLRRLKEENEISILNNLNLICKDILLNSFEHNLKHDPPKFNAELKKWEIPFTITIESNQNLKNIAYELYPLLYSIGLTTDDYKQYAELNLPFYNVFFGVESVKGPVAAVASLRTEKGMQILSDIILSYGIALVNFSINDGQNEFSLNDLKNINFNDYTFNNYLTYQNVSNGFGGKYLTIFNNSPIKEILIKNGYFIKEDDLSLQPNKFLVAISNNYGNNTPNPPFPSADKQQDGNKIYTEKIIEADRKKFGINEAKYSFLDLYESDWPQWDLIFSLIPTTGNAIIKFSKYYDEADLEKINGFTIKRKSASLN